MDYYELDADKMLEDYKQSHLESLIEKLAKKGIFIEEGSETFNALKDRIFSLKNTSDELYKIILKNNRKNKNTLSFF